MLTACICKVKNSRNIAFKSKLHTRGEQYIAKETMLYRSIFFALSIDKNMWSHGLKWMKQTLADQVYSYLIKIKFSAL